MTEKRFSLKAVLDTLDKYPASRVMQAVQRMYDTGNRGLFSEKFIPLTDMLTYGYEGFKRYLETVFTVNSEFVVANHQELATLLQLVRGDFDD